jgi:hypothetical protein
MEEILLSEYGSLSSVPSPVNQMMAAFASDFRDGIDVNLGVGYVNERTIPDTRICEAVSYVLNHPAKYRQARRPPAPPLLRLRRTRPHRTSAGADERSGPLGENIGRETSHEESGRRFCRRIGTHLPTDNEIAPVS